MPRSLRSLFALRNPDAVWDLLQHLDIPRKGFRLLIGDGVVALNQALQLCGTLFPMGNGKHVQAGG